VGIKQLYYKYIKNTPNQKLNGKTMKREKFIPETVIDEDVPAFMGALAQAAKAGKKEFKFGEKTYKVNLKKDVADKITKNMDEKTDFEEGNEFTAAAAKAKLAGKDEFEFEGKTYPVEIDQAAAEKILGKKESTDLERTNILTPDEYDEVSNFKNFNKKDWKWNAIQKKFVRKVKVKESTDVDQLTDALSEATASDYAKLSDLDLKDLLAIFRKVGNTAAKPIIKAIRTEMKRRSIKEEKETELEEAARPFKDLEKAWIRAKGNDKKREKLIKKHDLKPIISNVRPGAIKLGPLNSLNAKGKQEFTMVGLDADGELIFVSNNPLRIHYPSNVKDRPSGEEMKESVSLKSLRIRRAVELSVNESISERLDAFITESNIDATWTPSKIKNAYKKYIIEADYQLYHPTFTAAAQAALDLAKKKGFEVDEDDWFNQVSTGPKKPSKGKTNRYIVKVTKKGKETKKRLAFQVYGMDSGKYELNAYVESTQIQEVNESTMDKVNAIVSDKQASKIGGKMIDMQTASVIAQVYSKVNDATKKKMENEKIEKLVSIAQRVMAKESVDLEEATDTVDINTPTPDAAKRLAKKLANKWSELRSLTPKGKSVTVPNERAYIRYIEKQPEFEGIAESTDLEEIVGTVALGTVVAVSTLAAMLGVVKGAKYMASKLGDAAQSYVDKKDLAAFRDLKKSKYQDEIESIAAKFDGDTTLQSMYKSLPDWSSGTNKAAFVNNADRKKKMDQIAKHIKLKLDAEESKAFAAISKVLRSKNEEAVDLEEASATVQSVLKALRLKGGKDADALIKKMKDLGLESKVSKAHADAAKKILKGQITKFVKESDKDLDAKDLENMISDPDPSRFKQYGGKDKYIKMLKTKLAKLK
jgi:hypothetical protein